MKKKYGITSMYANPIHPGHIECLMLSKELVDELWVIVNNDKQAELKRGVPSFQDEQYRKTVVESIRYVDYAEIAIDQDGSVCETIKLFQIPKLFLQRVETDLPTRFPKKWFVIRWVLKL
jgi:cytidyltransferase-like protein